MSQRFCQIKPVKSRFVLLTVALFDLGFLVDHVLARLGIVLLDLHLFRHGALVLVRGVEVAGTGGRFELDFIAWHVGSP